MLDDWALRWRGLSGLVTGEGENHQVWSVVSADAGRSGGSDRWWLPTPHLPTLLTAPSSSKTWLAVVSTPPACRHRPDHHSDSDRTKKKQTRSFPRHFAKWSSPGDIRKCLDIYTVGRFFSGYYCCVNTDSWMPEEYYSAVIWNLIVRLVYTIT